MTDAARLHQVSDHMRSVFTFIRENGGLAIPEGGGFWTTERGNRINEPNVTQTIYALEKRGLLERRMFRKEAWRDTYAARSERTP